MELREDAVRWPGGSIEPRTGLGGAWVWGEGSATPTCELHKHPATALKLPSSSPGLHLALFVTSPTPR